MLETETKLKYLILDLRDYQAATLDTKRKILELAIKHFGGQSNLARAIGISKENLSSTVHGRRGVSATWIAKVQKALEKQRKPDGKE